MKKACVINPTYNERENISRLIPLELKAFKQIKDYEMHILVKDDNSSDGTANVVKKFMRKHKNIHLLNGEKKGLGAAYIGAFRWVMDKFDVIIMMDADLSHPPSLVPQLLGEIDKGNDFVIGSRYIKGGATPDWSLRRKIISRFGNFFARIIGGLYKVHDCTSGYRAIKTDLLKTINLRYLATRGYAFLSTSLYELYMAGAKVKEIPLVFKDRRFGETKLSKRDIIEFFFNSLRLRLKTGERFTRFCVVGFSGVIVNTLLLWFLFEKAALNLLLSGAIAVELSILHNFVFNDIYTFKDNKNKLPFFARMLRFNLPALYSFLINLSILYLLGRHTGIYYLYANLIGIFVAMAWNYIANIGWTWRVDSTVVYHSRNLVPINSKTNP